MSYLKNQERIIVTTILILMLGCVSNSDSTKTTNSPVSIPATTTPDVKSLATVEGWGVNPREMSGAKDAIASTDNSWYSKKYSGKASDRSIELKSASYMESTCRQAIKKENSRRLIESAFTSLNADIKPEAIASFNSKITQEDLKNIEIVNCIPSSPDKTYNECECYLSYKVVGGKKTFMDMISTPNK